MIIELYDKGESMTTIEEVQHREEDIHALTYYFYLGEIEKLL
ncbi:hypothetical protein STRDD04_01435 [Streptococcus sp. DD04]|nr:hypothetical protein STRDD04_01435 [Streptococcus sp. DD04]